MKRNPMPLLLLVIAVVLGFGLLFTGCNSNQAKQTAAVTDNDANRELAEREQELIQREIELNERLEIVEDREDELDRREEIEPEPRIATLSLPATTELEIELLDEVASGTSMAGDAVSAVVLRDVLQDGLVAIPAGSRVLGTVDSVVAERKIAGQARLSIVFDEIALISGESLAIQAFVEAEGQNQKKKDAATIGGSAAGGAILGRILSKDDKTEGTVIGAVVGAAVGTAVASKNRNDPVVIEAGTVLIVQLDLPVEVAIARI